MSDSSERPRGTHWNFPRREWLCDGCFRPARGCSSPNCPSATPSPEDASPGVGGREAIARIVDPGLWEARDRAFSGEPFTPWDGRLDKSLTAPSLAKADAILALSTGEGKEDLASVDESAARKSAAPEAGSSLDLAWAAVNVLGAPDTACTTDEDRAYCRAIGDALAELEKLGAKPW